MNLNHFTAEDARAEIDKLKKAYKEDRSILIQTSPEYIEAINKAILEYTKDNKQK